MRGGWGKEVVCVCVCVHLYDGTEVASIKEPQNVQQELVWEEPQHRVAFNDLHLPVRCQSHLVTFDACPDLGSPATSPPTR
jgi:hypothetical protein